MEAVARWLDWFAAAPTQPGSPWAWFRPFGDAVMQPHVPFVAAVAYLIVIFIGYLVMKNFKPFELKMWLAVHNFFLCAWSLVMVIGFSWPVFRGIQKYGSIWAPYCGVEGSEMDDRIV